MMPIIADISFSSDWLLLLVPAGGAAIGIAYKTLRAILAIETAVRAIAQSVVKHDQRLTSLEQQSAKTRLCNLCNGGGNPAPTNLPHGKP